MLAPTTGRPRLWSLIQFAPSLEQEFRQAYFERVIPTVRLVAPLMLVLLFVGLRLSVRTPAPYDLAVAVPQMLFWVAAFGLTWVPRFWRVWQPVLGILALLTALFVLMQMAPALVGISDSPPDVKAAEFSITPQGLPSSGGTAPSVAMQKFHFALQYVVLLVPLAMLRLQFAWSTLLYAGVTAGASWVFATYFPLEADFYLDLHHVLLPALLVLFPLLLLSFQQERLSRLAFWTSHLLEEERNDERRKHQETESKLHVLAQAIGGIVHDLGNPLASVQMGSETIEIFLEDETPDKALLQSFAHSIHDGAEMLNFLRLSLIEQTRVLEGKPTPITAKPVALRPILESSVRFQKPHVLGKRKVHIQEGDAVLCADAMKLVTVWMNLIGNALKYSSGDVQVRWHEFDTEAGRVLVVAVADQGTNGCGLSLANAAKLFSAFGRLEAHSQIEGTGLGLLSVQKIMQAHGGEAWIEGFETGTPASPRFSTSQGDFAFSLQGDERTAFVVRCPIAEAAN